MDTKQDCGCRVFVSNPQKGLTDSHTFWADINYCPKHEAIDGIVLVLRQCQMALTPSVMIGDLDAKEARNAADEILFNLEAIARAEGK